MTVKIIHQQIVVLSIRRCAETLAINVINNMADPADVYHVGSSKGFYINLPITNKLSDKTYLVFQDNKTTIDEIYSTVGELLRYE